MSESIDVSIIVPCYNAARFLPETIESVLTQKGPAVELILVDDGSTDATAGIIGNAAARDGRIIAITQENWGVALARNAGITRARGEFVGFLDSDDLLLPDKLATQVEFLRRHSQYDAVAGGFERIDETGRKIFAEKYREGSIDPVKMLTSNRVHISAVLMRRTLVERVGLMDAAVVPAEDWDFFCRVGIEGGAIASQETVVSQYRVVQSSLSSNPARMTAACLKVVDKSFSSPRLKNEWKEYRKEAEIRIRTTAVARALAAKDFGEAGTQLEALQRLDPTILTTRLQPITRAIAGWLVVASVPADEEFFQKVKRVLPADADAPAISRSILYGMGRHNLMAKKRMTGFAAALLPALQLFVRYPILATRDLIQSLSPS